MTELVANTESALAPLRFWSKRLHHPMPALQWCEPDSLSPACREILGHAGPMMPRLATHHKTRIRMEVSAQHITDRHLERLVRLHAGGLTGKVVAAAAVFIHLQTLPVDARSAVLAGIEPLGSVLKSKAIAHLHELRGGFTGASDSWTSALLDIPPNTALNGRCSIISAGPAGETIAEIVELLPIPA